MKKTVLAVLAFYLLCFQVLAATQPEYEQEKGPAALCPGVGQEPDSWSFYTCNCTSYAAWRLNEHWKTIAPSSDVQFWNFYRADNPAFGSDRWGHAKYWGYRAQELGITVDSTPKYGAIGWRDANFNAGEYGHVFFVEGVSGSQVKISEYNYDGNLQYRGNYWINANTASGYIHFTPSHLDYLKSLYNENDTAYLEVLYYQEECRITGLCDAGGEGGSLSALPDFIVKDIWFTDSNGNPKTTFRPGVAMQIHIKVKNVGTDTPQGISVGYYLSNGYYKDSNPNKIAEDDIGRYELEGGETHEELKNTTAPTTKGTYNFTAKADCDSTVTEEHESNNWSAEAVFRVDSLGWLPSILDTISN